MSRDFPEAEAFALSELLFRNTSDTFLRWNVDPADLLDTDYPYAFSSTFLVEGLGPATSFLPATPAPFDVHTHSLTQRLFAIPRRR